MRRLTAVLAPVVLVAGILAAVFHDPSDAVGPGQATLEVADGAATVTTAAGLERRVSDEATVDAGDVVEVVEGQATLRFADGSTYELRHRDGVGSSIEVGSPPRLVAGDALVADGFPAGVRVGAATLSALGALKVDAGAEVAAAYEGRTQVAGAGDVAELRGLRELVLVAGAAPAPLTFDGTDPWDRRYLGEAIAFGERLEALARGSTSDLPRGGGRSADFFRSVLPSLVEEREFGDDLLDPGRPLGDELVGAAIAVQGRQGSFRERWEEVFTFRGAGAEWGLVALDQGVSSAPLLEAVELAVAGPTRSGGATRAPGTTRPTSTASPSTSTAPRPGPTTTTEPPPPPPPPPPDDGLLDPADDGTSEVLDDLLDGLSSGR